MASIPIAPIARPCETIPVYRVDPHSALPRLRTGGVPRDLLEAGHAKPLQLDDGES